METLFYIAIIAGLIGFIYWASKSLGASLQATTDLLHAKHQLQEAKHQLEHAKKQALHEITMARRDAIHAINLATIEATGKELEGPLYNEVYGKPQEEGSTEPKTAVLRTLLPA